MPRNDAVVMRRTMPPVSGASTSVFFAIASASGCEKLASNILAAWVLAGEPHRAMDRHDGLAGARRSRHAGRAREGPLDQRALRRVQEDAPLLPRKGQRLLQFLLVGDQPNSPQRIGMLEGIGRRRSRAGAASLPVAANSSSASEASAGR